MKKLMKVLILIMKKLILAFVLLSLGSVVSVAQSDSLSLIRRIIRGFDRVDERYIEPQHYVFSAMVQGTYSIDRYTISSSGPADQDITFMGPYAGWKWVFLGYCFELGKLNFDDGRREFDFSMYSSQIGVDLFYRRTGSDYKLRNASLGGNVDASPLNGQPFDGIRAGITGFNVYYIFNHGRFSRAPSKKSAAARGLPAWATPAIRSSSTTTVCRPLSTRRWAPRPSSSTAP